ncbi:hypothetical protein KSE_52180 [Kitasatospora setae KM-6054]|uniref:Protein involved in plasmid replication-relaxation n=2 Tax=Streptomycetaceae TaxID=2062 RepID=E4NHL4_KITSK|nr:MULTISPECIES: replication-relaxation family protein [Kitasatospora]BAJ30994.1 hypothetical protein KSE_52180 [Kitasatospora setae KM-6054]
MYHSDNLLPPERALVSTLARVRVATVNQLSQVVSGGADWRTGVRRTRIRLDRLVRFGVIRRFPNTSEERSAGPAGYVYALTAAGLRLAGAQTPTAQRRAWQPKPLTLSHWLAISELYVQLTAAVRSTSTELTDFEVEADARRTFHDFAGRHVLRPDALVRLANPTLRWSYFIEVDRSTESPRRLAEKCQAYRAYELVGDEQLLHGVFPLVVFVVPDEHRAQAVRRVTQAQPADARDLFLVVTQTEAIRLLASPTTE